MVRQTQRLSDIATFPVITPRVCIGMLAAFLCVGLDSSLIAADSADLLPVRVELYEEMGAKTKSASREDRNISAPSDSVGKIDEPGNDDSVETGGFEGVRAVADGQIPDRVYRTRAFGFHRLPIKYDETGARELPKGPIVFRASATLALAKGQHQFVIRTREAATLTVDGRVLATVQVPQLPSDGHNPVQPVPKLIVPSIKDFAPGNTELLTSFYADGRHHTFTLETVVGRSGRRPEIGVLALAVAGPGEKSFRLLGSEDRIEFTPLGWEDYVAQQDSHYADLDARERAAQAVGESQYWEQRHAYAKSWLETQEQLQVPQVGSAIPTHNAIDMFIGRRIETATLRRIALNTQENRARAEGRVFFDTDIRPILRDNCLKCHADQKKGELRLDSLSGALQGGESEEPTVVPGHPEKSLLIELVKRQEMPPEGRQLSESEIDLLSRWIKQGAEWEEVDEQAIAQGMHPSSAELVGAGLTPLPKVDDLAFLRRVTLDTLGVIPTIDEIREFQATVDTDRRSQTINRLLDDPRWADHWVPFWQDILAENPNIVKPNLNNTGAFRWWIYESFFDNKPMDQFVTDLVRMRGDGYVGPKGFGMATQNDAPMAAKAHILGAAFMGIQMKCARCHDAPYQSVRQEDLFNLAAMLERKSVEVPASSIVPESKLSERQSLVKVTLQPNQKIDPLWPFEEFGEQPLPTSLLRDPDDPREMLAAHMTSPANPRFAKTIVNWVWKRYFGRGLVEPAVDWENANVTHPELLSFLARELVRHDYDVKHVVRMILNSHTYQRGILNSEDPQMAELFVGQIRRRMTAEQIVDSLHLASNSKIDSEELNMDQDGQRPIKQFINLGKPKRAWEFTSLSNERDRPSLTLPHAQVYVDVLEAFGWNGSRQNPIYDRDHEANILQPATLANGIMSQRLTRLTDSHPLTDMAVEAKNVHELIEVLFLKTLGRLPEAAERDAYTNLLEDGFDSRVIPEDQRAEPPQTQRYPYVTWSNHLRSDANEIKDSIARDIELGQQPTRYLTNSWRTKLEDGLWALLNSPEMIFIP